MAGGINNVDPCAFPFDRRVLGKNGDAALALDVVAVHRPFLGGLIVAVNTGLFEQFVNKGRLAVVNVGDNGDVTDFHVVSFLTVRADTDMRQCARITRDGLKGKG